MVGIDPFSSLETHGIEINLHLTGMFKLIFKFPFVSRSKRDQQRDLKIWVRAQNNIPYYSVN